MDIVVDANVLFSLFIKQGVTAEILLNSDYRFFAPEFVFEEYEEHKLEILRKTKRTMRELADIIDIVKTLVTIVPAEDFNWFLDEARRLSPDSDDVHYFALALKLKCVLWTNDKALARQSTVLIVTTTELLGRN